MVDDRRSRRDRIAFLGHSTVQIELAGETFLTDPLLRDRVAHLRRYAPRPEPAGGSAVSAVLLSHAHQDHLDLPSLRALGPDTPLIVPPGAGSWLAKRGFTAVSELAPGEEAAVGAATVIAVPADHDGRRYPFGPRSASVGFVMRGDRSIYFAGDTGVFEGMSEIAGGLDAALLPVAGWGRTLGPGHMDPLDAARAAALLRPRLAIPIHWGTFRPIGPGSRGLSLGEGPAREFAAHARELAPECEVRLLAPGEDTEL
jgi:L-ascorbate metabolism protein UlaG (beta-lactamase superfamily)